jgi:hypothetical protein
MPAHAAPAARILRADVPLAPYPERVTDDLVRWARETPGATFLAERDGERWRTISYAEMLDRVRHIGGALLAAGGSPDRPLAIIAENGIDHAAVALRRRRSPRATSPRPPTRRACARSSACCGRSRRSCPTSRARPGSPTRRTTHRCSSTRTRSTAIPAQRTARTPR